MMFLAPGYGLSPKDRNAFECFFTRCRSRSDTTPLDDLRAYAQASGLSDAEMAARLLELVKEDWNVETNSPERRLAGSALVYLGYFGGEAEGAFVLQVMQETDDEILRRRAACAAIRMMPEKMEWLFGKMETDKRFGNLDRFVVCREAFQFGREVDERARQRVIGIFRELGQRDAFRSYRTHLDTWIAELEGGDKWEQRLRQVSTGEEFRGADQEEASTMAFRVGRDGDEKTRRHVIEVLKELRESGDYRGNLNILELRIGELEKMP